ASPEAAEARADAIQRAIAEPFPLGERDFVATASIGLVHGGDAYEGAEELVRDAEAAMFRATAAGRAPTTVFRATMREPSTQRFVLEGNRRHAVGRGELALHYQAIVALAGGRICGCEALVRWRHPERGLLFPGEFISVAEEPGLVVPVGAWVLQEGCRQAKEW